MTHRWHCEWKDFYTARHRCVTCDLIRRTAKQVDAGFPYVRYTRSDGTVIHGKAPPCQKPPSPAQALADALRK